MECPQSCVGGGDCSEVVVGEVDYRATGRDVFEGIGQASHCVASTQ